PSLAAASTGAPGMGSARSCDIRPRQAKKPYAADPAVRWKSCDRGWGNPLNEYSMLCAQCSSVCGQLHAAEDARPLAPASLSSSLAAAASDANCSWRSPVEA